MNYYDVQIFFQEVPDEISMGYSITGCSLRCDGCHSSFLWKESNGVELTNELFESHINKYSGMISCVLFFGGEWHAEDLIENLTFDKIDS